MEIGSFIDLELPHGREYYSGNNNTAKLNSGRTAIYHAVIRLKANTVWLPYYQCDTVREFLQNKGILIKYYHIDKSFNPIDLAPSVDEAVVIVNYFGVMSESRLIELSLGYEKVIIDNSQAFFTKPLPNAMNVYSARKFVGVPDGAYVIGENAAEGVSDYSLCYSSDTAGFLLMRTEYGCEGKGYTARLLNEERIDSEDIMQMSKLTRKLLDAADYENIIAKRRENFEIAHSLFKDINKLDAKMYYDSFCVPMVYPLVVEDDSLLERLLKNKHFQGHWWGYLLKEMQSDSFEYWLSRYIIPITIDQRYGKEQLEFIRGLI